MALAEQASELPLIICGPILRRLERQRVVLWIASSCQLEGAFNLFAEQSSRPWLSVALEQHNCQQIRIGRHAWVNLIDISLPELLTEGHSYLYDIALSGAAASSAGCEWLSQLLPAEQLSYQAKELSYPRPSLMFSSKVHSLLHGSCRLPHSPCDDAMVTVDHQLQQKIAANESRPDMLLLTGDQIYADSVAGPLLIIIQRLIDKLGLWQEQFTHHENDGDASLVDSAQLPEMAQNLYLRQQLLPTRHAEMADRGSAKIIDHLMAKLGMRRQPEIFTSSHQENHLISMAEFNAMYLLVWSPCFWSDLLEQLESQQAAITENLSFRQKSLWNKELKQIKRFAHGLPACARVMANLPCYMIFDDHDITDDWNLTAGWEQAAYGHPFSRQIIGNGLISYLLFQGWGNHPQAFAKNIMPAVQQLFLTAQQQTRLDQPQQQALIEQLLGFERWHYHLPTDPLVVVLDSRTRRWRSERNLNKPSGLLDWEALSELQTQLINQPSVILVAPAPIFGVKFIEAVQRVFTWFGHPLVVDAENWMAHPGTANTLLNIFLHRKTPQNFIILSGDVHYSFVYDVSIRFRRNSPRIWQFTSSGIKNRFPGPILKVLETGNRIFFGDYSLFNWFTKRKRMRIRQRLADGQSTPRLINQAGIGFLQLKEDGAPAATELWLDDGQRLKLHSTRVFKSDSD